MKMDYKNAPSQNNELGRVVRGQLPGEAPFIVQAEISSALDRGVTLANMVQELVGDLIGHEPHPGDDAPTVMADGSLNRLMAYAMNANGTMVLACQQVNRLRKHLTGE